jgi:hypothetical protein
MGGRRRLACLEKIFYRQLRATVEARNKRQNQAEIICLAQAFISQREKSTA